MTDSIYTPDVVIVGGGVAGLTVALNIAPRKVCVITKNSLGVNTSSSWAQGGIAASISKEDSNENHINDTLNTAVLSVSFIWLSLIHISEPTRPS